MAPAQPVGTVQTIPVTRADSYFDGSTLELIGYNLLSAFVCFITLGIAFPWMHCMLQGWELKHTVIHGRRLKFDGRGSQLIGNYLLWFFLTLITFGIYGIWLGVDVKKWTVKHTLYADGQSVPSHFSGGAGGYLGIHILAFLLTLVTLGIGISWADVMILRWEAEHTHIGGTTLKFDGTGGQLFVMRLLLVLLTLPTLGIYNLFYPVKYMKWFVSHTDVTGPAAVMAMPRAVAAPKAPAQGSGAGKVLAVVLAAAAMAGMLVLGVFLGRRFVTDQIASHAPASSAPVAESSESAAQETDPPAEETSTVPDDTVSRRDGGFVFPDSATELIEQQELENLSDSDLTYAINELYARHGYIFRSDELQEYYEQFIWYTAEVAPEEFSTDCFNSIEQQNWNLLIGERSRRRSADQDQ